MHHGDVVEGDYGQQGLGARPAQTPLQYGRQPARQQLLRQPLVVGDQHDDHQQTVPHRQDGAAGRQARETGQGDGPGPG